MADGQADQHTQGSVSVYERLREKQVDYECGYDLAELDNAELTAEQRKQIIAGNTIQQDWAIIQKHPVEGDGVLRTKKFSKEIAMAKQFVYDKYAPVTLPGRKGDKQHLDPAAHEFLQNRLAEWTEKHRSEIEEDDLPYGLVYYLDLRIECIARKVGVTELNAEMMCKSHFEGIIRSRQNKKRRLDEAMSAGRTGKRIKSRDPNLDVD